MELFFTGNEHEILLPDYSKIKIRENNGDDEAKLSKISDSTDGVNIINFISSIASLLNQPPVTVGDVDNWKKKVVYYLLFKQRLINQGWELVSKQICENEVCNKETEIYEDLRKFELSETNEFLSGDELIKLYPSHATFYPLKAEESVIIELRPDLSVKYSISKIGKARKFNPLTLDNNNMMVERELKYSESSKNSWIEVKRFSLFNSREMSKIRTSIKTNDQDFEPIISWNCPHCGYRHIKRLFVMPDFYYPEVVI